MKKLLLLTILFLSVLLSKGQTYKADTLRYFEDVDNIIPDTTLVEEITIILNKGNVHIFKHDASFKAVITDTLPMQVLAVGVYMDRFNIKTVQSLNGYIYTLQLMIVYVDGKVRTIGLSRGTQLFLYHITNQLYDGNARQRKYPYVRDWSRAVLGQ